jgi:hypothetical protein
MEKITNGMKSEWYQIPMRLAFAGTGNSPQGTTLSRTMLTILEPGSNQTNQLHQNTKKRKRLIAKRSALFDDGRQHR